MSLFENTTCSSPVLLDTSQFWTTIAGNTITGILALIGIAIAAYLAYRYALNQKKKEIFIGLEQVKYQRKLNALEGCWKLLAFTTDAENASSILIWEPQKEGEKTYFIRKGNADKFLQEITEYFYGSGLGLYLTNEIKAGLFEYRNHIFGILKKEQNNPNTTIPIQKPELAKRLVELHQNLILLIKQEINTIDKFETK